MFMHQEKSRFNLNPQKMERDEWVINVGNQLEKTVVDAKRLSDEQRWQRQSIYKLPASVTNLNKNAYTPRVVSFGPYHCENDNLKPMEEHKDRALIQFLFRTRRNLQSCIELLKQVVEELKDAYDMLESDLRNSTDAFLKIMIRDGCFMHEIFRASKGNFEGYPKNDPIFSQHGRLYVFPHIRRDMLMLENQLPMKVLHLLLKVSKAVTTGDEDASTLEEVLDSTITKKDEEFTNKLVCEFLFSDGETKALSDCLHILHLHRKILLGSSADNLQNDMMPNGCDDITSSATQLSEAGITIKGNKSRSIKDIKFDRGVLSLPMIVVDDTTEPLYLNLMAFERFHFGAGNDVTSYVFFMDNIIDDARDINLLHSKDIIRNGIGSDKAAAKLFNSLSKDVTLGQNSHLGAVYRDVKDYREKWWPKHRENLIHTYFTSPWASLSVVAAVFLFALTIISTVYGVMDYYNK